MQYEKHIGRRNLYISSTQIWGVVIRFLEVRKPKKMIIPRLISARER